ncbi:hypothetical protein PENTCL1PPCAC_29653, partial [Pristionchus entomophagus]
SDSHEMTVRAATKADLPDLFHMNVEMAIFQKVESEVHISLEQFIRDFEDRRFEGFVLIDDETEKAAGMALYHYAYDVWKGTYIAMEELFVRPEYRNKKYGKLLWAAVAQVAKEKNATRLNWLVHDSNKRAMNFYHSVEGVAEDKMYGGFLPFVMNRQGIERFVESFSN